MSNNNCMDMLRAFALKKPITAFLSIVLLMSWVILTSLYLSGLPIEIGLIILNYLGLLGVSLLISYWLHGKKGMKALLAGVFRWKIHFGYYLLALFSIPLITLIFAAIFWNIYIPQEMMMSAMVSYIVMVISGALIINLWEETAWSGFVQRRLMQKSGILIGSLLTAPSFVAIHLPLLLQQHGLWDIFISFIALAGLALFFRYLVGMLFVDTKGSLLIVGLLHASFNSSGSLRNGEMQIASIFATIFITIVFAAYRKWIHKSDSLEKSNF